MAGYDPRCCFYPKTSRQGKVTYYLQYYLPGGKRVSYPIGKKKKEAKLRGFEKECNLKSGIFEERDLDKIPSDIKTRFIKPRIPLEDALNRYMKATSYNRQIRTNRLNHQVLKNLTEMLEVEFIDEVKSEHVQRLAGMLQSRGLSQASIHSYLSILKTFFNWLIEIAEVLDGRNPVNQVKKPPRSSKVRDYLVKPDLIRKIFMVESLETRHRVPIIPLARFICLTGCRLGEAIHLEWQDIDFLNRSWKIGQKTHCPTLDRMGWAPKWKKPRTIKLIPEALEILESLPRHEVTWGSVRKQDGVSWHQANFVFTVENNICDQEGSQTRHVRIGSVKRAWASLLEKAGVPSIQIKDLRTFFNWFLITKLGLSHKEAGLYLGNSEQVNFDHYTPVCLENLSDKLNLSRGAFLPKLLG